MTITLTAPAAPPEVAVERAIAPIGAAPRPLDTVPRLSPRLQLVRALLVMICVLSTTLVLQLVVVSWFQQRAAQQRAFDALRAELAEGTAPIGPADDQGRELAIGRPVAHLEIPAIGLEQVIVEGTTPGALFDGPGHRRDTPLPGQEGSSIVMGRRAAFGAPFRELGELEAGDEITVTTGQGIFEYEVLGVREEGDPVPPAPGPGESRLTLVTAGGHMFLPDGVLRVDADLQGDAVGGPARVMTAAQLPAEERIMAGDTGTLWVLVLWLQALIALAVGSVVSWHRWGHAQTWVVFLPLLLFVGLATSGEVARLLPNLL